MPYGYIGQNLPNQTKSNSGVFSISDVADLEKQGKFGGSLELIEEQTASANSSVNFTDLKNYDVHYLSFNLTNASTDTSVHSRLSNNGGSSFIATGYQRAFNRGSVNGSFLDGNSTNDTQINMGLPIGNSANDSGNGYIYFYNLLNSSKYSFATFHTFSRQNTLAGSTSPRFTFGGGVLPTAETHNALQLVAGTGTFDGTIKLYGVKQL